MQNRLDSDPYPLSPAGASSLMKSEGPACCVGAACGEVDGNHLRELSLRLNQDVIEWFKARGPGYQTRINAVSRAFRDASA